MIENFRSSQKESREQAEHQRPGQVQPRTKTEQRTGVIQPPVAVAWEVPGKKSLADVGADPFLRKLAQGAVLFELGKDLADLGVPLRITLLDGDRVRLRVQRFAGELDAFVFIQARLVSDEVGEDRIQTHAGTQAQVLEGDVVGVIRGDLHILERVLQLRVFRAFDDQIFVE